MNVRFEERSSSDSTENSTKEEVGSAYGGWDGGLYADFFGFFGRWWVFGWIVAHVGLDCSFFRVQSMVFLVGWLGSKQTTTMLLEVVGIVFSHISLFFTTVRSNVYYKKRMKRDEKKMI